MLVYISGIIACNKNTDQLPPRKAPPHKLVLSATINGLEEVDFIFHQTQTSESDTVWLSLKNNTATEITQLRYVVELCRSVPQNFDNCDLQVSSSIAEPLLPGNTLSKVFTWVNKKIKLDSALINPGVVSYTGLAKHPLSNVYSNIYALFEGDSAVLDYYGTVRGYILADGVARFRLKGKNNEHFFAEGFFPQTLSYTGLLFQENEVLSPFSLDSIEVLGNKVLYDTANGKFNFRITLNKAIRDTTRSVLIFTQRNY